MKRSEAIEILANKIERCHDRYGNLNYTFRELAEELMEDLEEIGMLPPLMSIEYLRFEDRPGFYVRGECDHELNIKSPSVWESEDE